MRIGCGVDVHQLVFGRPLILGGVRLPSDLGLAGHSDADVVCHALMDALLSAARLPDIGELFPDTDPAYADANSLTLLSRVAGEVAHAGLHVVDCDITLCADTPKIAPYKQKMRENVARSLGVAVECVGLKATTFEGLGFVGEHEGMLALATCLLDG